LSILIIVILLSDIHTDQPLEITCHNTIANSDTNFWNIAIRAFDFKRIFHKTSILKAKLLNGAVLLVILDLMIFMEDHLFLVISLLLLCKLILLME